MKKEFITSYLTFYMKATVELAGDFIKVANPNSILKVIPLGVRNKSIPVNQVSSVDESFKLDLKSFIWGIIFILIGLSSFKSSLFAGVLITIYGAITVLSSFQTIMSLQLTSGGSYDISVVVFEKENLAACKQEIEALIQKRYDNTNVAVHTEKQTEALVEAIKNK